MVEKLKKKNWSEHFLTTRSEKVNYIYIFDIYIFGSHTN